MEPYIRELLIKTGSSFFMAENGIFPGSKTEEKGKRNGRNYTCYEHETNRTRSKK
jgi:hypothetical protein